MPERIFIRHDLPAPFSPTIASTSPELSSNWTPLRAWTPGNDLAIPETSRRALTAGSRVRPKTPRRKVARLAQQRDRDRWAPDPVGPEASCLLTESDHVVLPHARNPSRP